MLRRVLRAETVSMTTRMIDTDDVTAIRAMVAETERLQSDADGFAELLTPDVVLVNAMGRRVLGRDAVRDAMVEALQTPMANVMTRNEVVDIRFIRPDVALVVGVKHIFEVGGGSLAPGSKANFSFVLVRERETWQIAVAHNTLVQGYAAHLE
jgi:uncharacterized protein (TIGR02246 family)